MNLTYLSFKQKIHRLIFFEPTEEQTADDDSATPFLDTTDLFTTTLLNNATANTANNTYTHTRIPILVSYGSNIIAGTTAALGPDDDDDRDFAIRISADEGETWGDIVFPWGQDADLNMLHNYPLVRDDGRIYFFVQMYDVNLDHIDTKIC